MLAHVGRYRTMRGGAKGTGCAARYFSKQLRRRARENLRGRATERRMRSFNGLFKKVRANFAVMLLLFDKKFRSFHREYAVGCPVKNK
mmetsp:Transcript_16037/g.32828  ORF Transcript_16037/g.32828 Transcript_16037/m.32828 type:complete len:88 (+) Transcript_16037:422-685(+)